MKTTNNKRIQTLIGMALAISLISATALAQTAAKVTAKQANIVLLPQTIGTGDWQTILANKITTDSQKDLFIGAALEVGMYTFSQSRTRNLEPDVSLTDATVAVRVLVDGQVAEPGEVNFGRRSHKLTATLQAAIASCSTAVSNADGTTSYVLNPNCVPPQQSRVILNTMDAMSFNFVLADLPSGVHNVAVQARVDTTASPQQGQFEALGTVGKGTMTLESVFLIPTADTIPGIP